MLKKIGAVLALLVAMSFPVGSEPLPRAKPAEVGLSAERLGRIGEVLKRDIDQGKIPGAVIAIARDGKLAMLEAYGFRDKSADAPMKSDAIFNIASMTKPMVAVAALDLVERGVLVLDEPVSKYLPDRFASMKVAVLDSSGNISSTASANRPISVRDLLIHTSGLVYGGRGGTAVHKLYPASSSAAGMQMTGDEFLARLSELPLLNQPGAVWDYGFGLDVLGLLLEKMTKHSLGSHLSEVLFKPLGMSETGFYISPEKATRYARALPNDPETGQPQSVPPDATLPLKFECGGGCAVSTADDYLRFATMLLNSGEYNGRRVLSRTTTQHMLSNQIGADVRNLVGNADPTKVGYGFGLGLAVRSASGVPRLFGNIGDFSWPGSSGTNWWVDPHERLVVVFMAHSPGPARWHYRYLINALVYQALEK